MKNALGTTPLMWRESLISIDKKIELIRTGLGNRIYAT